MKPEEPIEPKEFRPKTLEEAKADPLFVSYVLGQIDKFIEQELKKRPDFYLGEKPATVSLGSEGLSVVKMEYAGILGSARAAATLEQIKGIAIEGKIILKEDSYYEQLALAFYNHDLKNKTE